MEAVTQLSQCAQYVVLSRSFDDWEGGAGAGAQFLFLLGAIEYKFDVASTRD